MNNVFSFKRFGNYFQYDLHRTRTQLGWSMLCTGLLPVIFYVFVGLISLIATGSWNTDGKPTGMTACLCAEFIAILAFPAKLYGPLTDKKEGTQWLMIPASTFEKWLSMVIVLIAVIPLGVFLPAFGTDALLSLIVPDYGTPVLTGISGILDTIPEPMFRKIDIGASIYLNWVENILAFGLGAIIFRKSKAAKTILAYSALIILIIMLMVAIFRDVNLDLQTIMDTFHIETEQDALRVLKWMVAIIYVVFVGGFGAGLYARIKTLKH